MAMRNDDHALHKLAELTRQTPPHLNVLFVDPDRLAAQRLAAALGPAAFVTIVPTAAAAWDVLTTQPTDMLVTEVALPDASGIELLARVHNTPQLRHVLLLIVTHTTSVNAKVAAFQAGADNYLIKPVEPDQFLTQVRLLRLFSRVRQVP